MCCTECPHVELILCKGWRSVQCSKNVPLYMWKTEGSCLYLSCWRLWSQKIERFYLIFYVTFIFKGQLRSCMWNKFIWPGLYEGHFWLGLLCELYTADSYWYRKYDILSNIILPGWMVSEVSFFTIKAGERREGVEIFWLSQASTDKDRCRTCIITYTSVPTWRPGKVTPVPIYGRKSTRAQFTIVKYWIFVQTRRWWMYLLEGTEQIAVLYGGPGLARKST